MSELAMRRRRCTIKTAMTRSLPNRGITAAMEARAMANMPESLRQQREREAALQATFSQAAHRLGRPLTQAEEFQQVVHLDRQREALRARLGRPLTQAEHLQLIRQL